jgi:hypothetical protein
MNGCCARGSGMSARSFQHLRNLPCQIVSHVIWDPLSFRTFQEFEHTRTAVLDVEVVHAWDDVDM